MSQRKIKVKSMIDKVWLTSAQVKLARADGKLEYLVECDFKVRQRGFGLTSEMYGFRKMTMEEIKAKIEDESNSAPIS